LFAPFLWGACRVFTRIFNKNTLYLLKLNERIIVAKRIGFLFFIITLASSQTISVNPDSISLDLFPGDSIVQQITINNTGTANLDVSIDWKFCADYKINQLPYFDLGSTLGSEDSWPVNGFTGQGGSEGPDKSYLIQITSPTYIDITLCHPETDYDAMLEIFTADNECVATSTGHWNDDNGDCVNFNGSAIYPPSGLFGVYLEEGEYYIVVDGFPQVAGDPNYAPGEGTYKIQVSESSDSLTNRAIAFEYLDESRLGDLYNYYFTHNKDLGRYSITDGAIHNTSNNNRSARDLAYGWLVISPTDTTVQPDSSVAVSLTLQIPDNEVGHLYDIPIDIHSNDTLNPFLVVPLELFIYDIFPPEVPEIIEITPTSRDIQIVWTHSGDDLFQYNIYRGTDPSSITLLDSVVGHHSGTVYGDRSTEIDQRYYYQISAVDSSENESERSGVFSAVRKISLIISEIMNNPSAVEDAEGEWFEVLNNGTVWLNLNGWKFRSGELENHTLSFPEFIFPGEYRVFGLNSDTSTNGGVDVFYQYDNIVLSDTSDILVIVDNAGTVYDSVSWDNGLTFPLGQGASMALLDPELDNNVGTSWVLSELPMGNGDYGTPGGLNFYSSMAVAQDSVYFSSTAIGVVSWQQIAVLNTGNGALLLDTVFSDNRDFSIIYPDTSFMTASYIDIGFGPSTNGHTDGLLTVVSNDPHNPEKNVHLFGFGFVDSLPPSVPIGFNGVFSDSTALFTWSENPEDDIAHYVIDKSIEINFVDSQYVRFVSNNNLFVDSTYVLGELAFYRLCAVDHVGNSGDFSETIQLTILNTETKTAVPASYALHQNFPNPFNPTTTIEYEIKDVGDVVVEIFNVLGKRIKRYAIPNQPSGYYSMKWLGKNEENKHVGAGVYFYSLTVNDYTKTRKMVLLK